MTWPTEYQDINKYLEDKEKESFQNLSRIQSRSRDEDRELWGKVILMSSGILGVSVSLASSQSVNEFVNFGALKASWIVLIINIGIGLWLLKRETKYQQAESFRNSLLDMDRKQLGFDKTNNERIMALELLHARRQGSQLADYANQVINKHRDSLQSWQLIKNPERFYRYYARRTLDIHITLFYVLFTIGLIGLILSMLT